MYLRTRSQTNANLTKRKNENVNNNNSKITTLSKTTKHGNSSPKPSHDKTPKPSPGKLDNIITVSQGTQTTLTYSDLSHDEEDLTKRINELTKHRNDIIGQVLILNKQLEDKDKEIIMLNDKMKSLIEELHLLKQGSVDINKVNNDKADVKIDKNNESTLIVGNVNAPVSTLNECESSRHQKNISGPSNTVEPIGDLEHDKRNILLLGTQAAKGVSKYLNLKLNNMKYSMYSIIKTNANFNNLFEDVSNLTRSFNKNDLLILIGGYEKIPYNSNKIVKIVEDDLNRLVKTTKHTKVKLFGRFNKNEIINKKITQTINNYIFKNKINFIDIIEPAYKGDNYNMINPNKANKNKIILTNLILEETYDVRKIPVIINNRCTKVQKHFLTQGHMHIRAHVT